MQEQQKSIDEIFRQSLGDYREAPPAAAWETVARRLDNDDGPRRRGYFMRWPWISLLLLLLIGGGWFIAAKYGGSPAVKDGRLATAPITTITGNASAPTSSSPQDTAIVAPGSTTAANTASGIPAEASVDTRGTPTGQKTARRKTADVKAAYTTAGRRRTHHAPAKAPAQTAGHNVLSSSAPSTVIDKEATGSSGLDTDAVTGLRSVKKSSRGRHDIASTKAGRRSAAAGAATGAGRKDAGVKKAGGTAEQPAIPAGQAEAAKTQDTEPATADQAAANKLRKQQSAAARRHAKEQRYAATSARAVPKAASSKGQATEQQSMDRTAKASATKRPSAATAQATGAPAPDHTAAKPASVKRPIVARQQPVAAASKSTVSKRRPLVIKEPAPEDSSVAVAVKQPVPKKIGLVKASRVKKESPTEAANEPVAEVATALRAAPANRRSSTKAGRAAIAKSSATVTEEAVQTPALPQPVKDPVAKKSRPASGPAAQKRSVAKSARAPQQIQPGKEAGQGNPLKSTAANPPEHTLAAKGVQPSRKGQSTPAAKRSPATKQPAVAKESPAGRQALPKAAKPGRPGKQIPAIAKNTAPAKSSAATENPDPASPAEFVPPPVQTFTFSPTTPKAATAADSKEEAGTDEAKEDATGGGGGGGGASPAPGRKRTSFISLAALAGYEVALQTPAPNMVTGGLRLLWHFDPGIAVGIQPAFRYGDVTMTSLSPSKAYQQRAPIQVDSLRRFDTTGVNVIYRSYSLRQAIDSVIISGVGAGGPFWQLELPIILSYKIAQAWHLYGGASVNFSGKLSTTTGARQTYTTVLFDSVRANGGAVLPARPASSFENYFPASSSLPDISTYKQEENVLKDAASVRFGYVFGLGYEWKRIIFDASIHQQVSGYSDVNQPIQHVYSSPNVRLSLGFFLIPPKSVRKTGTE